MRYPNSDIREHLHILATKGGKIRTCCRRMVGTLASHSGGAVFNLDLETGYSEGFRGILSRRKCWNTTFKQPTTSYWHILSNSLHRNHPTNQKHTTNATEKALLNN